MPIDWSLANGPDAFEKGWALGDKMMGSFRQGQEDRRKRDLQKAVATFSTNPDDPAALQSVIALDPELGMRLSDYSDKRAFNAAMGQYLAPGGQPNALLGMVGRQPAPVAAQGAMTPTQAPTSSRNALTATLTGPLPGASFNEAFAPIASPATAGGNQPAPMPPANDAAPQPPEADLSFLGEPQTGRDRAFLAMVRRDPIKALKIQSTLRESFVDRLKDEADFYGLAIQQLSSARDEASWQAGIQRLAPMAQALGGDLLAHVPAAYPGPDAVEELMQQALPVKERLDYIMRAANMEADNARADRNTDSLIDNRESRLAEQRRATDERIATTRRGQDLTDKRGRIGGGRSGSPRETIRTVRTPEEARKLPSGTKFRTPDGAVKIVP